MNRVVDETSDPITQAAAEWVVRRDRGLSSGERYEFERWHAADPRHASEFARIGASWQSLDRLAPAPALSADADAVMARAHARRVRRRFALATGGLVAAAAAVAFAFISFAPEVAPQAQIENYRVIASASRTVTLPDGSVATLNGDSRIETHYSPGERRIRLVQGEALFTVVKDPNRPFLVGAGPVTVRAVGTAFNVRLANSAVEVVVTQGMVRVDDSSTGSSLLPRQTATAEPAAPASDEGILSAGQRVVVHLAAVIDASTQVQVAPISPHEIEQALAWQSTRLSFNDTSLDDVIAAFNRHTEHKFTLGDPELRSRKITGVFRADNVDGFARLLEAGLDVRAERRSERETVLFPSR